MDLFVTNIRETNRLNLNHLELPEMFCLSLLLMVPMDVFMVRTFNFAFITIC